MGLVLWEGVELLDLAGPGEVLSVAGDGKRFRLRTLAPTRHPLRSQGFLTLQPDGVLGEDAPPDILIIPGGASEEVAATPGFIDALGAVARDAPFVFTVCTGALLLARTGLLAGREATTWHGAYHRLRELEPTLTLREGARWVDSGDLLTAAGVSAGIDAALHLVGRVMGQDEAIRVARYMEYNGEWNSPSSEGVTGRAREARQTRGEFLLAMTHELRTPIHSLSGAVNRLLRSREDPPTPRQREQLEGLRDTTEELLTLVGGITELARVDAGRMTLRPEPVDLAVLIREVVKENGGARPKPGVMTRIVIPPGVGVVRTDPNRLRQLLSHLVENAVRFTRKGSVEVALRLHEGDGSPLAIQVTDTGPGIPQDRLEAIFQAFEQGGDEGDTSFAGAGLGLALARALGRALGYRIRVRSRVGEGSTFTVALHPEAE